MGDTPPPPADPTGPAEAPERRRDSLIGLLRSFSRLWGFLLFLLLVIVLFRQVVLPFVFAVLIAYLLAPIVRRLEPKTTRAGAVILVYVVILTGLAAVVGFVLPAVFQDLAKLRDSAPDLIARLNREWLPKATVWLDQNFGSFLEFGGEQRPSEVVVTPQPDGSYKVDLEDVRLNVHETGAGAWVVEAPSGKAEGLGDVLRSLVASKGAELTAVVGLFVQSAVRGVATFVTDLVITFMLAAFILVDLRRLLGFIRSLIPPEFGGQFDEVVSSIAQGMAGVVRGQLVICLVNGTLTYIGLLIFGVKYSLLLAMLAAVFSLIPIFGTIISSIPILLLAMLSGEDGLESGKALGMLGWIAGIHLLEANFLNPKIIGDSAHIHPVVVVFSLLAGESVFGLTGALLAVPVASIIQSIFLFARKHSSVFRVGLEPRADTGTAAEPAEGGGEP